MAKTILSEHTSKRVFLDGDRVYKEFSANFPKAEVFHEAYINVRAEHIAGKLVPAVLSVENRDGRWTIIKEYVQGKTLAELMREAPEKEDEHLKLMLDLQLKIQSFDASSLEQLKTKMARQINSLAEIDDGVRYELLTRLNSAPLHTKLCHGDIRPENIIIDEKGELHLIDWVHAAAGNASADIARTCLILALKDKRLSDKYMDMFCQRTATARSYVQNWLPVVAAAQLTKRRPEEEAELKAQLNICDHM